jgi:hypothetical protein
VRRGVEERVRDATLKRGSWLGAGIVTALLVGFATPAFLEGIRVLGRHIPQTAIERDYLVGLLWATLLAVSVAIWPVPSQDKRALLVLWLAKVFVTLGAMLAYEWHYDLDAYGYYWRSTLPGFPLLSSTWTTGTAIVQQFGWVHARVLPDSYHAMKVTFALVGLIAVYLIYRGATRYLGREDVRILYLLGLFPSVLFWSSILGKEPLHLLAISIYVYGVLSWRATNRSIYAVVLAIGVIFSFLMRPWSGPILLLPLVVFILIGVRRPLARIAFLLVAVGGFAWTANQFAARFNIETMRDVQTAAEARSHGWQGGSGQRAAQFTDAEGMLKFAPLGVFTALFRPLPGEVRNPFGMIAGVENVFLLILLGIGIFRARWSALRDPALTWAIVLILTWSAVYSFVSYYNFGAAVRFKLQILPILLLVLLRLATLRPVHVSEQHDGRFRVKREQTA